MPYALNGRVQLWYDTFGLHPNQSDGFGGTAAVDRSQPPGVKLLGALVLINGMTSQSIFYPEAWCEQFVAAGLFVIRMDNREVGLSSASPDDSATLSDYANDVLAVLDAVGVAQAHIHGVSLGGMIAQTVAIEHPTRVASLISVMSSTGEDQYRRSAPEVAALLTAADPLDEDDYVAQHVEGLRAYGSPRFADELRWRSDATMAAQRAFRPAGPARQYAAARRSSDRTDELRALRIAALVMHGSADTLIEPLAGRRTAALIPGSRYFEIDGMGHDYPPELWPEWTELVVDHVRRVAG